MLIVPPPDAVQKLCERGCEGRFTFCAYLNCASVGGVAVVIFL